MAWATESIVMAPLAMLAILTAIPPLVLHLRAKNFAASVLLIGVTILNLQNFINAVIWHSIDLSSGWDGKILCDIELKLYVGVFQVINGAIASIFRQISIILHPDHITLAPSPRQRRITLAINCILCIFLPLYVMVGHYLTQRSRYWLRVSAGCVVTFDTNYVAPFLTYLWPLVASLIGSIYCLISSVRLYRHRKNMASVLSHTPGATSSRFYRLFTLALTLLAIYGPVSVLTFAQNIPFAVAQYSWSYIHPPDWSERIRLSSQDENNITFDRWAQVLTAYLNFLFFGLSQEATQTYKIWITQTKSFLGIRSQPCGKASGLPSQELMSFDRQPIIRTPNELQAQAHTGPAHPHNSNISELGA